VQVASCGGGVRGQVLMARGEDRIKRRGMFSHRYAIEIRVWTLQGLKSEASKLPTSC